MMKIVDVYMKPYIKDIDIYGESLRRQIGKSLCNSKC